MQKLPRERRGRRSQEKTASNDPLQLQLEQVLTPQFGTLCSPRTAIAKPQLTVYSRIAPAIPTIVYDTYWYFAAERQRVFFRRLKSSFGPWTADPILKQFKFTNAYRASDRVSQFLIRNVIYRDDLPQDPAEIFFRILLFKIFNRIETWELLERSFGAVTLREYHFGAYDFVLTNALSMRQRIYSAAYIMPPGTAAFGFRFKHQNHLRLIETMLEERLPDKLLHTSRMQDGFDLLRSFPTIGDFLAYQFITDLNYSNLTNYSENDFVIPGPGARDGLRKCFSTLGGLSEMEAIRMVAESQEDEFRTRGIIFPDLWGRALQYIDCQNLFCEVDKYSRVAHPEIAGISGRLRIKQQFREGRSTPTPFYPPKWGLKI